MGGKPLHDCTPFTLDLQYLKDCGECEPSKAAAGEQGAGEDVDTFDARLYAKDSDQLLAEMSEAMDTMQSRIEDLEVANARLKSSLAAMVSAQWDTLQWLVQYKAGYPCGSSRIF